jgi:hypothetical protein
MRMRGALPGARARFSTRLSCADTRATEFLTAGARFQADPGCTVIQYQENRDQGRIGSQCFLYNGCALKREQTTHGHHTTCGVTFARPHARPEYATRLPASRSPVVSTRCFYSCVWIGTYASDTWCFKIAAVPDTTPPPDLCGAAAGAADPSLLLDLDASCADSHARPETQFVRFTKGDVNFDHCPRTGTARFHDATGAEIPVAAARCTEGCLNGEQADSTVWSGAWAVPISQRVSSRFA